MHKLGLLLSSNFSVIKLSNIKSLCLQILFIHWDSIESVLLAQSPIVVPGKAPGGRSLNSSILFGIRGNVIVLSAVTYTCVSQLYCSLSENE